MEVNVNANTKRPRSESPQTRRARAQAQSPTNQIEPSVQSSEKPKLGTSETATLANTMPQHHRDILDHQKVNDVPKEASPKTASHKPPSECRTTKQRAFMATRSENYQSLSTCELRSGREKPFHRPIRPVSRFWVTRNGAYIATLNGRDVRRRNNKRPVVFYHISELPRKVLDGYEIMREHWKITLRVVSCFKSYEKLGLAWRGQMEGNGKLRGKNSREKLFNALSSWREGMKWFQEQLDSFGGQEGRDEWMSKRADNDGL